MLSPVLRIDTFTIFCPGKGGEILGKVIITHIVDIYQQLYMLMTYLSSELDFIGVDISIILISMLTTEDFTL